MESILVKMMTTISEFKKNPTGVASQAGGKPFAVLKNNKALFYVLTPERFEELLELEWERTVAPEILERANSDRFLSIDIDSL